MRLLNRISNQDLDRKIGHLHEGLDLQIDTLSRKLEDIVGKVEDQSKKIQDQSEKIQRQSEKIQRQSEEINSRIDSQSISFNSKLEALVEHATRNAGALLGERTPTVSQADYEQKLVRGAPGKIFNREKPCTNPAFVELLKQANGDEVVDSAWQKILAEALVEATSVPGAAQVFERQAYIEDYLSEIALKFRARYAAGWVTQEDALFLYWLVRQTKPRRIVQCGAFNGRSSAFMMLALAKNGPEGTLTIIDQPPPVFDSKKPEWTIEGSVYGAVVPAGKTSGWMVPDQYRNRLKILNGDVNDLLPKVVDNLEGLDLFYHASDHTYQQLMFEFEQAKRKLSQGGLVVTVDTAWNSSLWDFTERHGVPSYTFKNAVGVGFF